MKDGELFSAIGDNIRKARRAKSVSQQDLAAMLNIEKSNLSRIEAGRTNITIRNLYRISLTLGVPLSELADVGPASPESDGVLY